MSLSYRQLDQVRPEIRLLRFLDCQSSAGPLQLELRHAFLDDLPSFAALSYVWGEDVATDTIFVDNTPLAVRSNLHAALLQMRKNQDLAVEPDRSSWLWIDTICIDQVNIEEKSHQVSLMHSIYGLADLVYMWLGPGTEASDLAMDFVCRFGPKALGANILSAVADPRKQSCLEQLGWNSDRSSPHERLEAEEKAIREVGIRREWIDLLPQLEQDPCFNNILRSRRTRVLTPIGLGIEDLMKRDFWHRIWVVQEISLARKAIVLCGTKSASAEVFDAALSTVNVSRVTGDAGLSGVFYQVIPLDTRRRLVCRKEKPALLDILMQYVAPPDRPFYSASDPRDLIFSLLGVIGDTDSLQLGVDYRKTVAQVFTETTKALLKSVKVQQPVGGFGLRWCAPNTHDGVELPSWVCDWSNVGRYGFRVWPISYNKPYSAAAGTVSRLQDDHEPEVLRLVGCRVAVITEVMEPPQLLQRDEWSLAFLPKQIIPQWLSSIQDFVQLGSSSGPGEDCIWRTIRVYDKADVSQATEEDVKTLIRQICRGAHLEAETLTPIQLQYIDKMTQKRPMFQGKSVQDSINIISQEIPRMAADSGRHRTLFKTNKLMLGLGHVAVQRGDIVTLLWGHQTPFVLRPREEGGLTFVGDAYVDGIMHGEFLNTPIHEEVFDIH